MKKPLAAHRNYSNIEIVLLFTILFMIAAIGLYVQNARDNADTALVPSSRISASNQPVSKPPAVTSTVLSNGVYAPTGQGYSIRLADGWKLNSNRHVPAGLMTFNNNELVVRNGVNPIVTQTSTGKDGSSGFFLNLNDTNMLPVAEGVKQANLTTNDGLSITKYVYSETTNQTASVGNLANGGIEYTYLIASGARTLSVLYRVNPTDTNYRDTVETVVKSVRFN